MWGLAYMQRAEEEFGGLDEEKEAGENDEAAENGTATTTQGSGLPWDGSDRDYTYEELLGELPYPGGRSGGLLRFYCVCCCAVWASICDGA